MVSFLSPPFASHKQKFVVCTKKKETKESRLGLASHKCVGKGGPSTRSQPPSCFSFFFFFSLTFLERAFVLGPLLARHLGVKVQQNHAQDKCYSADQHVERVHGEPSELEVVDLTLLLTILALGHALHFVCRRELL